MADPYIDQYETIAYGRFAVAQIQSLVIGLDPESDEYIKLTTQRLRTVTDKMATALEKVGALNAVTYSAAESTAIVDNARSILRRLIAYTQSRVNGDAIAHDILKGETLSTVVRRRPVKIAAVLDQALQAIEKHQANFPEHQQWSADVAAAAQAISALNGNVRKARTDRRAMTPEVEAARNRWLLRYAATKLIIEGILKPLGKTAMMPEIFDDLAEVHRAPGVADDPPPAPVEPAAPQTP